MAEPACPSICPPWPNQRPTHEKGLCPQHDGIEAGQRGTSASPCLKPAVAQTQGSS